MGSTEVQNIWSNRVARCVLRTLPTSPSLLTPGLPLTGCIVIKYANQDVGVRFINFPCNEWELWASQLHEHNKVGSMNSDMQVIQRVLAGDTESYRILVDVHKAKLFGVLMRILADPQLADEVSQDCLLYTSDAADECPAV